MIPPYNEVFSSLNSALGGLGFKCKSEGSHAVVYVRSDGFHLTVSIERFGDDFSVVLAKPESSDEDRLLALVLMEVVAPESAIKATRAFNSQGNTLQGIIAWWAEFLDFLKTHEEVVFAYPFPEPYRTKYQAACRTKMRILGLDPSENGEP